MILGASRTAPLSPHHLPAALRSCSRKSGAAHHAVWSGLVHCWARFLGPRVPGGRSGPGRLVQAGVDGVRVLVRSGHAGAAHGHGDILLDVDGATARAARGPAQDHRGHEHWGAAQAHVPPHVARSGSPGTGSRPPAGTAGSGPGRRRSSC